MSNKAKVNTIIDGTKPVDAAEWFLGGAGVKDTAVRKLDEVEEYVSSEASARQLDPPGSAKAIATATRRVHELGAGMVQSGLTKDALCLLISEKCPRSKNGTRIGPETVESVLKGILRLNEHLR